MTLAEIRVDGFHYPGEHCSVTSLGDSCIERRTVAESFEIVKEALKGRFEKALHAVRGVRGKQYVGQSPEGVARGKRFGVENVERGAADGVRFQCVDQRGLIDHRAAADVHYHGARLHGRDFRHSDEAFGLRRPRSRHLQTDRS